MKDLIYIFGVIMVTVVAGILIGNANEFSPIVAFMMRFPALYLMVHGIYRLVEKNSLENIAIELVKTPRFAIWDDKTKKLAKEVKKILERNNK